MEEVINESSDNFATVYITCHDLFTKRFSNWPSPKGKQDRPKRY